MIDSNDIRKAQLEIQAQLALNENLNCFMAHWVLQNPDKNVDDYKLVAVSNFTSLYQEPSVEYFMRKK